MLLYAVQWMNRPVISCRRRCVRAERGRFEAFLLGDGGGASGLLSGVGSFQRGSRPFGS